MTSRHPELHDFPVVIEVPIAWGDMDAFGHVNNTMFFRYFESARIAYLDRIEFRGESGIGPILAATQCRFRRPLAYPDTALVGARIIDLKADRFVHEYKLVSLASGTVAAVGSGDVVGYDYKNATKCEIPPDVVRLIRDLQPELVQ